MLHRHFMSKILWLSVRRVIRGRRPSAMESASSDSGVIYLCNNCNLLLVVNENKGNPSCSCLAPIRSIAAIRPDLIG